MSFATLVYHEIRENHELHPEYPSPIEVSQEYEDNLPAPLFIGLDNFLLQMEYLYKNNYHTLTLNEVMNYYYKGESLPEKSLLLTFDDCYQSIAKYAYPVLKDNNFSAVAFVVSGWLNASPKPFRPDKSVCLTVDELKAMSDVFEYANHTDLFHTRINTVTSIMMEASDLEFSKDLDRCNLSPILGAKEVFAYPFGLYSDRNVALLKDKGFRLAFTTNSGRNDLTTDSLLLKRNVIPNFMELTAFQNLVTEV